MADSDPRLGELEKRLEMLRHEVAGLERDVRDDVARIDGIITRIEHRLDKLERDRATE